MTMHLRAICLFAFLALTTACHPAPVRVSSAPTGCPVVKPGEPRLDALEVVTTIPVETDLEPRGSLPTHGVWREMLQGARTRVDLWHFYLTTQKGSRLEPVIAELAAAARRGVRVRLLIDKKMSQNSSDTLALLRRLPGIRIAAFDGKAFGGGVLHAKAMLVDGREAYLGSANFDWRSLEHVHETGLRISSPAVVSALEQMFELDFRLARGQANAWDCARSSPAFAFPPRVRLVASPAPWLPRGVGKALDALVELIDGARKEITVQLLSYVLRSYHDKKPFNDIDEALRRAAGRGVKVRILVSDWNLSRGQIWGIRGLAEVQGVEVRFVSIPQARSGYIPFARVLHSKVLRVDDSISWVGTSNWSGSYFRTSRNVELIVEDLKVARTLSGLFEDLWSGKYATKLDPTKQYRAPKHD